MGAFLKLFDVVPGFIWALIVAGCLAVNVGQALHVSSLKLDVLKAKNDYSGLVAMVNAREATRSQVAAEAEKLNRKAEQLRADAAQGATRDHLNEKATTVAAVAAAVAERDSLYKRTAALTASPSGGGECKDPAALPRSEQRALAFGGLLQVCDAVAEDLGRKAEDLASQVRDLKSRYLSLTVPSSH